MIACEKDEKKSIAITEVDFNVRPTDFKECLTCDQVYIVNTQEDYEELLGGCVTDLPQINFSQHSFVIVWGNTGCLMNKSIEFSNNGTNSYNLKVNLQLGFCNSVDPWYSAFYIHSKIVDNATINLIKNEFY